MPIHAHDGTKGLKPIWIAEPRKEGRMAVVKNDAFGNRRPELRHAIREPCRHAAAVQRQIRDSRALHIPIVSVRGSLGLNSRASESPLVFRPLSRSSAIQATPCTVASGSAPTSPYAMSTPNQ